MARPSKLTPSIQAQVVLALRNGHYLKEAAHLAGVSERSLHSWLADARAIRKGRPRPSGKSHPSDNKLLQLLQSVEEASAHAVNAAVSLVMREIQAGNLKAATLFLEHKLPKEWGGGGFRPAMPEEVTHDDSEYEEAARQVEAKIRAMAERLQRPQD